MSAHWRLSALSVTLRTVLRTLLGTVLLQRFAVLGTVLQRFAALRTVLLQRFAVLGTVLLQRLRSSGTVLLQRLSSGQSSCRDCGPRDSPAEVAARRGAGDALDETAPEPAPPPGHRGGAGTQNDPPGQQFYKSRPIPE